MPENNPMLDQLRAELQANPHFAEVADKVSQEMLGAPFKECMNAHPDVATVEGRWLGTLKRLVCNTILMTYQNSPAVGFNAKWFTRAQQDVAPYVRQVQGFRYEDDENQTHVHVVRDLSLPASMQQVWRMAEDPEVVQQSEEAAKAEYERCHEAMMLAIAERGNQMAWTHYLWGVTSGHFADEEEK